MEEQNMANTLDKIRAAIAEHEEKLAELRAAEKVVNALDNKPQTLRILETVSSPETMPRQTVGAAIMATLSDGPQNLATILERVNATGKSVTDQSISSALQILKKKNLVVRRGRMWKIK